MDSALADALIGRTLDGRYHVRSRIAYGGMATVYLAEDSRLDRLVALKVMHAELARDEDFVQRFIGEAKSVARLSHPNIVAVFDQGTDGANPFLAMEYVPGRTLRSLMRERGRLPAGEALDVMVPILSGLAAAHQAGVVHRDVKPENVLVTDDGRVKVVDFGLARAQTAAGQTSAGVIMGTVAYIAPEQVTGSATDSRTDVYAAGVMLFEMLTGRQPYTAETPVAVARQHVNSDVPAPSGWMTDIPPAVDHLVRAATSRDPRWRPADAGAFLRAVLAVRAGRAAPAPQVPVPQRALAPRALAEGIAPPGGTPPPNAMYQEAVLGGEGTSPHTVMVPGMPGGYPGGSGYPAAGGNPAAGGYPGGMPGQHPSHPLLSRPGGYPPAAEPLLQRWLFSRRLALVVGAVVVVAAIGIGGWWLLAGRFTPVPRVTGQPEATAEAMLRADGFAVRLAAPALSNGVAKGDVLSVAPSGHALKGTTIVVTLSAGPRMITVPPVAGQTFQGAVALLRKAGLRVSGQPRKVAGPASAIGSIVGTTPPAGTSWPVNRAVYVDADGGVSVPSLVGQDAQAVQQQWAQPNGISLNVQPDPTSTQPNDIITRQSPQPGTLVVPGKTAITIYVSQSGTAQQGPGGQQESGGQQQCPHHFLFFCTG